MESRNQHDYDDLMIYEVEYQKLGDTIGSLSFFLSLSSSLESSVGALFYFAYEKKNLILDEGKWKIKGHLHDESV